MIIEIDWYTKKAAFLVCVFSETPKAKLLYQVSLICCNTCSQF